MKKNYFFVLVALLSFALCSYAQDDTTQDENYNMTVKLPDGTTLTVNTDDVDEVTFSNGTLIVTGTRIDEIVAKLKQIIEEFNSYGVEVQDAKAYIEQLVADFKVLQDVVNNLKMKTEDNTVRTEYAYKYAIESLERSYNNKEYIEANQKAIEVILENIAQLQADMAALREQLGTSGDDALSERLAALAAELADTRALSQQAMAMSQQANDRGEEAQETAVEALNRAYEARAMANQLFVESENNKAELKAYTDTQIAAAKAALLAEMMNKAESALQEIMPYINELQTSIANLTTTVSDQNARIAMLENTVVNQNAQIATLANELNNQIEKNAELEARVTALEAMLKNVEGKLDNLNWQLGVKEQRND